MLIKKNEYIYYYIPNIYLCNTRIGNNMTNLQKMIANIHRGDPEIYGDITTNEIPQLLAELILDNQVF